MADLKVKVAGITLRNPVMNAAGVLGLTGSLLCRVASAGVGAVVTTSISKEVREGYPGPVMIGEGDIILCAMGWPNPGYREFKEEIIFAKESAGVPVIGSIIGHNVTDIVEVAKALEEYNVDMIELNTLYPFNGDECMGYRPDLIEKITGSITKEVSIPVTVKLPPYYYPKGLKDAVDAVENGEAQCITAIGPLGLSMDIETKIRFPYLGKKYGYQSGHSIFYIGLGNVAKIAEYTDLDIIGVGGISNGIDCIKYFIAGATAVQIGSGILKYNSMPEKVFPTILKEIDNYLKDENITELIEIIGTLNLS